MDYIPITLGRMLLKKIQLKTQLLKACLFQTMFQSNRSQSYIVMKLTGCYAILSIDKNRLNSSYFYTISCDDLMYLVGKKFCAFHFFHIHAEEALIGVKNIFVVHENC